MNLFRYPTVLSCLPSLAYSSPTDQVAGVHGSLKGSTMSELLRYANGEARPPIQDRALARRAKRLLDDVRFKGMQAEGSMALAAHIMEGVVNLDAKRQELAQGDPVTMAVLADIQATAVRQAREIQNELTDRWRI